MESETTTNETVEPVEMETAQPEASLREILAERNKPQEDASLTEAPEPEQPAEEESELERLRAQVAFFEQTVGDSFFSEQKPVETKTVATEKPAVEPEDDLLAPMTFDISDEEAEDITLNGSKDALKKVLARQAEVLTHNHRLDTQKTIMEAVAYALPTYLAGAKFAEKNPELSMIPNADKVIEKTLWSIRQSNPQASDSQLLRLAEKQLRPVIDKAKAIVSQSKSRKDVGASQQPRAVTPSARAHTGTPRPSREPSAQDRVRELREWGARHLV